LDDEVEGMLSVAIMGGLVAGIVALLVYAGVIKPAALIRLFQPYRARELLTANERDMFARLAKALPEKHVFPQVAMGALVMVAPSMGEAVGRGIRARFDRKIVDFVVVDRETFDIEAIVELDDQTHDPKRDAARDRITRGAGYKTVRFDSRRKPDAQEIRLQLGFAA